MEAVVSDDIIKTESLFTNKLAFAQVNWLKSSQVKRLRIPRNVEDCNLDDESLVVYGFEDERTVVTGLLIAYNYFTSCLLYPLKWLSMILKFYLSDELRELLCSL